MVAYYSHTEEEPAAFSCNAIVELPATMIIKLRQLFFQNFQHHLHISSSSSYFPAVWGSNILTRLVRR